MYLSYELIIKDKTMIPYVFVAQKSHNYDGEIITSSVSDLDDLETSIYMHLEIMFETNELYISIDNHIDYPHDGRDMIDDHIDYCYEHYWHEPYQMVSPFMAKYYYKNKWMKYDCKKIVKKLVTKYLKENHREKYLEYKKYHKCPSSTK